MIEISIAICTYNSRGHLAKVLLSVMRQAITRNDYEVIVINNNSIENLQFVQQDFKQIKYFVEVNQGLSFARNRAIREAQGKWIVFIDDDAEMDIYYLENIYESIKKYPTIVAIGGKVLPRWEKDPPKYLLNPNLHYSYSLLNWGEEEKILSNEQWIVGTNMVFRKNFLVSNNSFDEKLGRIGNKLLSNEEIIIVKKIHENNLKILYQPRMQVYHWVAAERMKISWLIKRYYWQGISDQYLFYRSSIKVILSVCKRTLNLFINIINLNKFIENLVMISYNLGYLIGTKK